MLRQEKDTSKTNARFGPAMMLEKTNEVCHYYVDRMSQLQARPTVQHYYPKGTFGKERESTLSQPVELQGR